MIKEKKQRSRIDVQVDPDVAKDLRVIAAEDDLDLAGVIEAMVREQTARRQVARFATVASAS